MKRFVALLLIIFAVAGIISGCSGKSSEKDENKLSIVTTVFPIYDWVKNIAGDAENVETTMLIDNGVDLHSFQPTAKDILTISKCDVLIYAGGESDAWITDALNEKVNKNMKVISLIDALGEKAKEEETVEGMEDDGEDEEGEEGETEFDEHVWLSLKNAAFLCNRISDELCEKDVNNKSTYASNAKAFINEIEALDKEYEIAVNAAGTKTLLFGDRFPFRYMTDDYGLAYYAAFKGCSAETEASFETISFLAGKVDELGLKAIMQIETSDGSIAETIRKATKEKNQKILTLDSMQSVTSDNIKSGTTYLSIAKSNLKTLKEALK